MAKLEFNLSVIKTNLVLEDVANRSPFDGETRLDCLFVHLLANYKDPQREVGLKGKEADQEGKRNRASQQTQSREILSDKDLTGQGDQQG